VKSPPFGQSDLGAQPIGGPPERLGELMASETEKWKRVIETSAVKPD
jgi:hypothetical protein